MKEKLKIYVHSPYGCCKEAKKLHLNDSINDVVYTCPSCGEEHSYKSQWFGIEPHGKTIMCRPKAYPVVDTECSKCHFIGTFFIMKELHDDHIIVEDGDFNLKIVK